MPADGVVQGARLDEVPGPQDHLRRVERLGDEVIRARGQGLVPRLGPRVAGDDEHGDEVAGRKGLAELLEDREPVDAGHVEVEHHQIGPHLETRPHGKGGVRDRLDRSDAGVAQDALEQDHVRLLVVDDHTVAAPRSRAEGHSSVPGLADLVPCPRSAIFIPLRVWAPAQGGPACHGVPSAGDGARRPSPATRMTPPHCPVTTAACRINVWPALE